MFHGTFGCTKRGNIFTKFPAINATRMSVMSSISIIMYPQNADNIINKSIIPVSILPPSILLFLTPTHRILLLHLHFILLHSHAQFFTHIYIQELDSNVSAEWVTRCQGPGPIRCSKPSVVCYTYKHAYVHTPPYLLLPQNNELSNSVTRKY